MTRNDWGGLDCTQLHQNTQENDFQSLKFVFVHFTGGPRNLLEEKNAEADLWINSGKIAFKKKIQFFHGYSFQFVAFLWEVMGAMGLMLVFHEEQRATTYLLLMKFSEVWRRRRCYVNCSEASKICH